MVLKCWLAFDGSVYTHINYLVVFLRFAVVHVVFCHKMSTF